MKKTLKQFIPHISAIVIMLVVSSIFFLPQLSGYLLEQSDYSNYLGMSKEILDHREKFDEEPLWTNSMFGGMPAYQISTKNPNIVNTIKNYILLAIPRPIGYMFFLMIGFYIMLLCFKVDYKLALLGAVVFGFATLNILLLSTGHNTKVHAISFIPPIIGSIYYAYRRHALWGGVMLSIFLCLHLSANHIQMTYYLLFLIAGIILVEMILFFKDKLYKKFITISSILLFAAVIGTLPTISNLIVTYEYGKSTIRGKSELTITSDSSPGKSDKSGALDKSYIKEYSFSMGEVWSVAIPNIKGGKSSRMQDNPYFKTKVDPQLKESVAQRNVYWGEQRGTGGSIYFGAGIFLLFILGAFFIKDKSKWALIGVSGLAIILSIKHAAILDLFIDYFPLFNKFRDTKMMLMLAQVCFPLMGVLFLNLLFTSKIDKKKFLYVTGGVSVLFLIFYAIPDTLFAFFSRDEIYFNQEQLNEYSNNAGAILQINAISDEIKNFRITIFRMDVIRSLGYIIATGLLIYFFILGKIKKNVLILSLGALFVLDLWIVDRRYLDNDKIGGQYKQWVDSYDYSNPIKSTNADISILNTEMGLDAELKKDIQQAVSATKIDRKLSSKQKNFEKEKIAFRELNYGTSYRVFSLRGPFASSRTSYFHKSIGGYHGAKLRMYQDVVEFNLGYEQQKIIDVLQNEPTLQSINNCFRSETPVLNMLNTKYIIASENNAPLENNYNFGNVWFVNEITFAESADEEILTLKSINKNFAIVNKKYQSNITPPANRDQTAQIELTTYKPNHLTYTSKSLTNQYAVFSEIYYADGWNVYLDGEKTDYFKTNYILRGMNIPAGNHTVEFKFEPKSYYLGRNISTAGSVLILLFIGFALFTEYRKRKQTN